MNIVSTSSLTKEYAAKKVVDSLSFDVKEGEIFGLLGPNGAGKTTTIRMLSTLTRPSSGTAVIAGADVVGDPGSVKSRFGIVQQHISLNRELTVWENMELHARVHHISKGERQERIGAMLASVGMTEFKEHVIETLSGGMVRRVMIARALLHRPPLLFLDEPTVGLDAQSRRKIWDIIRHMNSSGTSIILTTHYIEEAEALCTRVGVMHKGALVATDSPQALKDSLGKATVEIRNSTGTDYRFFGGMDEAKAFVSSLDTAQREVLIRATNLEDVFVEITGQKVKL